MGGLSEKGEFIYFPVGEQIYVATNIWILAKS